MLGFLFFAEVPDFWTLIGAAIVIASGLYTFYREAKRQRAAGRAGIRAENAQSENAAMADFALQNTNIPGVILAGGRSSRMGQDKATVMLGGRSIARSRHLAACRHRSPLSR